MADIGRIVMSLDVFETGGSAYRCKNRRGGSFHRNWRRCYSVVEEAVISDGQHRQKWIAWEREK
jgi:hypothetical protein